MERILGHGGMGDVYEGFDEKLTRRVALKVLHHDARLDAEARTRLNREARSLSQLDHPNICRIYDFIEDGETDVLVLELIDGRTLQQAVDDGLSRMEKLRIARDVASVLVAAHRAGIVHRDLKPENVMLTRSGQVKVLDFGLARWLERERKSGEKYRAVSPAALAARLYVAGDDQKMWLPSAGGAATAAEMPSDFVNANATAVGVTVGTPLFMSPEQARGEPLTTASDVYSFGLMLQALFTGHDPYAPGLSAREVMIKASRGDSLPVTGVTHDIAVLIKGLKAMAPSDRLTAADTLQRIQAIIDKPKRIAWQAALAAMVALIVLGVWKYTVDLRRERAAAQAAAAEAKHRRAQADSLIGFMVGDLRTKLEPVGRLDILDAVAERSLEYMSSLDPKTLTAAELARNAKALSQLGEVRVAQANLPEAVKAFTQSLKLAQSASAREPKNPELELGLGTAHFWVGNALRLQNDIPGALAHMQEYRRVTEDLGTRYPNNDEYQVERAYGHSSVGSIYEAQGDFQNALTEHQITLDVASARLTRHPGDAKLRGDVANMTNKVGFVLERLGRLAEARSYFEREAATLDGLTHADPKNARWKDRVANNHEYLASVLEELGDVDGAAAQAAAGASLYEELLAHDPTNADWRRNVASSESRHAALLLARGAPQPAIQKLKTAESMVQQLLQREPRPSWRRDLGTIDTTYARALAAAGDLAAARQKAAAAVAAVGALQGPAARIAAESHIATAEVAEAMRDSAAAAAEWNVARQRIPASAAKGSDLRLLSAYARALFATGDTAGGRLVLAQLQAKGYRGPEINSFCAKKGC